MFRVFIYTVVMWVHSERRQSRLIGHNCCVEDNDLFGSIGNLAHHVTPFAQTCRPLPRLPDLAPGGHQLLCERARCGCADAVGCGVGVRACGGPEGIYTASLGGSFRLRFHFVIAAHCCSLLLIAAHCCSLLLIFVAGWFD